MYDLMVTSQLLVTRKSDVSDECSLTSDTFCKAHFSDLRIAFVTPLGGERESDVLKSATK